MTTWLSPIPGLLRRDPAQLPVGFAPYRGDYTRPGSLDFIADLRPAHVVASFNPAGRSLEGYQRGFTRAALNLRAAGIGGTLLVLATLAWFVVRPSRA